MSRAFVINGDEWGYCIQMSRKCSGADAEGNCMRSECTEINEWEKPKRSLDEIRRAKAEAELAAAIAAKEAAKKASQKTGSEFETFIDSRVADGNKHHA